MNNFNILIIEDESLIALRIKKALEKAGYRVIGIAKDSVNALDFIQNNVVELIVADITISGYLNGIETVKLIQESYNISAIFLTAHQEEKFLKQASEVNFIGYIVKPYLEEHLLREVKLAYFRIKNNDNNKNIEELGSNYIYNLKTKTIHFKGEEIILSKNEKCFLHILVLNKNKLVSVEQIDLLLWHDNIVDDTTRRQLLFRVRKKLDGLNIETIKGIGYKLVLD
jgi:DNA-binding response OmpR family regulator